MITQHIRKSPLFLAVILCAVMTVPALTAWSKAETPAATATPGDLWSIRCDQPKKDDKKAAEAPKTCEVFQRLAVKKTGQRVVEFAVGFSGKERDSARGVIIMPLGILLTEDLNMQIDDGAKFKFKVRFCTGEGCFAYLDINKQVLDSLRNGKVISITGKASTGQDLLIKLELAGFDKTLKKL